MKENTKILVAGASGMVGSSITRKLLSTGHTNIVGTYFSRRPTESMSHPDVDSEVIQTSLDLVQLDLTDQDAVETYFKTVQPEYVVLAAAKVGGIIANNTFPAQFLHENLAIQSHVIHSAYRVGVKKLLFLGSSCIYPKCAPQPIQEEYLLTGPLEPTNEPYAIAKIAGLKMCEAYNRQYGTRYIALMPTNLYGPNDNFDPANSHVLPALIRKFHEAKIRDESQVVVWGTGTPRREFLYVDDLADACLHMMHLDEQTICNNFLNYPNPCYVNVGAGLDISISELAGRVREIVEYKGEIIFDTSKPDGAPQKCLDVSRMTRLGWRASIDLSAGIKQAYQWYCANVR